MRHRVCLLGVLLVGVLLIAGSAAGFNGQRKGFVLGGGLGFSPAGMWSIEYGGERESDIRQGVGLNLLVGYAWDDRNMIVYEGNGAGHTEKSYFGRDLSVAQSFNGAAWYHYFRPAGNTPFTVGGVGLYSFDVEDEESFDSGLGGLLGVGFEFSRHWQVASYFSFGKTSLYQTDFGHNHFNILISSIAF